MEPSMEDGTIRFGETERKRRTKDDAIYGVFNPYSEESEDVYEKSRPRMKHELSFVSSSTNKKGNPDEIGIHEEGERETSTYKIHHNKKNAAAEKVFGPKSHTVDLAKEQHDNNFASFLKHSSSGHAVMKMMQKMEFKGRIGKEGREGIANPIEVRVRKGREGLAFSGSELTDQQKRVREMKEGGMSDEEDDVKDDSKFGSEQSKSKKKKKKKTIVDQTRGQWKKRKGEKTKKKIVKFKTVDEVLSEKRENSEQQVVVDMRGSEKRVFSSMKHLKEVEKSGGMLKELRYNCRLLVERTESEIADAGESLRKEEEQIRHLEEEEVSLKESMRSHEAELEQMQRARELIVGLQDQAKANLLSLETLSDTLCFVKKEYNSHYRKYRISRLASILGLPLLQRSLNEWNPLEESQRCIDILNIWWKLLVNKKNVNNKTISDVKEDMYVYIHLLEEAVLPKFRESVQRNWNVKEDNAIVEYMDDWQRVLPRGMFDSLLEQCFVPKFKDAVENWDPREDSVPIHFWIHPWLPFLKKKLSEHGILSSIKTKFVVVLRSWHPSDPSAMKILQPWRNVMSVEEWDLFLLHSVAPKLKEEMTDFVVDPQNQQIQPLEWLMKWIGVMSDDLILSILQQTFFPKWYKVLEMWLNGEPNFEEIMRWYIGWKSLFPQALLGNPKVRVQFNFALDMMNKAMGVAISAPHIPSGASSTPSVATASVGNGPLMSFKEVVERFAEDHNKTFLPKGNAQYEGKQVYMFENVPCYLDQHCVYVRNKGEWIPVSFEDVLRLASGQHVQL